MQPRLDSTFFITPSRISTLFGRDGTPCRPSDDGCIRKIARLSSAERKFFAPSFRSCTSERTCGGSCTAVAWSDRSRKQVTDIWRVLLSLLLCVSCHITLQAATPADLWKLQPIAAADLNTRTNAFERDSASLPTALRPAVEFQKILLRIATGAPVAEWRPEIEKFAKPATDDPAAKALRELALCWETRARMQDIDHTLRQYYRQAVRFPDKLDEVRAEIPAGAKTDPWGEAWIYKLATPQGFSKMTGQRYQLGPTRHPQLSTLPEFLKSAAPSSRNWKATIRNVGGAKTLEIHTPDGQAAVVQTGGRVADADVVFIGDNWALFADTERLFAISF